MNLYPWQKHLMKTIAPNALARLKIFWHDPAARDREIRAYKYLQQIGRRK